MKGASEFCKKLRVRNACAAGVAARAQHCGAKLGGDGGCDCNARVALCIRAERAGDPANLREKTAVRSLWHVRASKKSTRNWREGSNGLLETAAPKCHCIADETGNVKIRLIDGSTLH